MTTHRAPKRYQRRVFLGLAGLAAGSVQASRAPADVKQSLADEIDAWLHAEA